MKKKPKQLAENQIYSHISSKNKWQRSRQRSTYKATGEILQTSMMEIKDVN